MTEDGGFVWLALYDGEKERQREGVGMSEREQETTAVELLLQEPEIVAWLDDYRPRPHEEDDADDDGPWAA
jgi:hypothetical protein